MKFSVKSFIRRYFACNSGATLPLVGLTFIVLFVAVGLAVDYGRAQMVESKMQAALDSAALAAATEGNSVGLTEDERKAIKTRVANKYMEANFPVEYMDTFYPAGDIESYITELEITDDGNGLSLTAKGRVETMIMGVVGFDTMDVTVHTEIAIETNRFGLEVVLVLDNTGSMTQVMGGESKLTALKRASKALVADIYAKFDSNKTYIGIVPFGNTVRVGAAKAPLSMWKRESASSDKPVADPVNCIYTDSTYNPPRPPSRHISHASGIQVPVKDVIPHSALFYNASHDTTCGSAAMRPMTNDIGALENAIDSMVGSGYTRIDLGAVWGWRMLEPSWRGFWNHAIWSGTTQLPLDANVKDMSKVAIILTDGYNEDPDSSVVPLANNRLSLVCNNMKARGIIVYTVTLHSTGATTLMRNCATSTQHYFHVAPGESLDDTFAQIADSLANLRISR